MLEDGLSYPFAGDKWIGRTIIGGVLGLFSFLLLPIFPLSGYFLHVIDHTVQGKDEPPEWDDWGGMSIDGLKLIVVAIAYSIIPFALIFGLASLFLSVGVAAGDSGGGLFAGIGILTMLLFIPAFVAVAYILPAALGNMAIEGNIGAAFALGDIADMALTVEYLIAVLMPIVVNVLLNIVVFVLSITVIGLLLVPFVLFYGEVAIFRMYGLAFRKVRGGKTATDGGTPGSV